MRRYARLCAVLNGCIALLAAGVLGLALFGILRVPEAGAASDAGEPVRPAEDPAPSPEGSDPGAAEEEEAAVSPSDSVPPEQRAVLEALQTAFRAGDVQAAGDQLAAWMELYQDPLSGWQDLTGLSYADGSLLSGYTGIALAMDGPTRFYYGPLENGVPEGEGLRLAHAATRHEECDFFWLDGTWSGGVLTGAAEISIGQTDSYFPDAPLEFMQISCTFDGTAEERMASASITQRQGIFSDDTYHTLSFQYNVSGGAIVPGEWTEGELGCLICRSGDDLNGYTYHLGVVPEYLPVFQNPYPWGEPYRFPYQDLFGQLPSLM